MKSFSLLLTSFLIILSSLYLLGQSEVEQFPFPDDCFIKIDKEINKYQDYDYELTKINTIELLNHAIKCEEEEIILLSYTALEFYSWDFNKREDFEIITNEADSVFKSILTTENLSKYADYYFDHLNFYSLSLFRKNEIAAADTLISNAIKLLENNTFEQSTKDYYLTAFYHSLSSYKDLQWNFNEGLQLLNKSNILENKTDFSLGYINQNYSSYHQKIGNYSEALDYAEKSLKNYKNAYLSSQTQENSSFYSLSLIRLAKLYIFWKNPEKSRTYLNELQSLSLSQHPLVESRFLQTSAKIDLLENNLTFALKNYQKCLKFQREKLPNRITETVEIHRSIAKIHRQKNQLDSTFHYLQKAIIILTDNPNLNDVETNPTQFETVIYKQILLDILHNKSNFLLEKYQLSKDICHLKLAMQCSESSQDLADKIRLDLTSNFDKELFSKKGHKIYMQAMQIADLSEEYEHSKDNIDFAYRAMESSRALILAEAVYQSNTKKFAGIPITIIEREEKLREQIIERERQIFQLDQEGADTESYKEEKRILQASFNNFTDSLQALYPDYYNLKFAVQRPNIKALQADLESDNQTFVEYFLGEEKIYALIIAANRYELKTWERSEQVTDKIKSLRSAIYSDMKYKDRADKFVKNAHSLYQDLILPLGTLPERIVLVPDGVLNYLPFDVLLTDMPEYTGNYQSHDYLLNTKQISYEYSATLRMQGRKAVVGKVDFMGFAPYYGEENAVASRGVGNLKFNMSEVEEIKKLIGGVTYLGEQAKKQNFTSQCHNAGILHFAGHAVQEEINPDFSHLLFSRNTINNKADQMPVKEIYAQHIPTKMVVLSACNTGMGNIQEGEGMYSLGRAFSYAGAHSLISTLWSVNDESTQKIMGSFYKNLKEGMTKDKALQEAKKSYIAKQTHSKSIPLYWAGFVAYGDMKDMEFGSSWFNW